MTDASEASVHNVPLPPVLQDAIGKFRRWGDEYLKAEQNTNMIDVPLYHYTDGRGLKGIIESGRIWFTDYRHMNDPSELIHGIEMAHHVARLMAPHADGRVRLFLETFIDMFRHANFEAALEFFIASFSRERNDLGQWRAYADNGRGFAIGFSPRMFSVVQQSQADRPPEFVGPVHYTLDEIYARYNPPILEAAKIFLETVDANADLVRDKSIGIPFMQEFARELIASPLIWLCLTSKHPAYEHEHEVRLVIMGAPKHMLPFVTTRIRGSEIVPYISQPMPVREPNNILEIVVGPSSSADAERSVHTMLNSLGVGPKVPCEPFRYSISSHVGECDSRGD